MGWWSDLTGATAKRKAARELAAYNNEQADLYADKTRQQFGNLAAKYEALQGTQRLDGLGNVNAWLDPSTAYRQQQATNQVMDVYGNSGKLRSGPAMAALNKAQMQVAGDAWQQALNNYMGQTNANNQMAMQGNQQNFNNNFQTANMLNQADATRFNTATQGQANVASVQAPSGGDAFMGLGSMAIGGANATANIKKAFG
jgi:hypothetical protein